MKALKKQVGGDYYKKFKIQPWVFIEENQLGFTEGCIIKYICRYRYKNGKEDLEKIKHYVDMLIEKYYPEEEANEVEEKADEKSKAEEDFSFSIFLGKKVRIKTTLGKEFSGWVSYVDEEKLVLSLESGETENVYQDLVSEISISLP